MPSDRRARLPLNRVTMAWEEEAQAMGVPTSTLIVADLARLRRVLSASAPALTAWESDLLAHALPAEGVALIEDVETGEEILSGARIASAVREWADGADEEQMLAAERLAARAERWTETERWAVMVRLRPR